ncbi:MAG: peroxidase family protein [Pyrinomonadaceae bacterium]
MHGCRLAYFIVSEKRVVEEPSVSPNGGPQDATPLTVSPIGFDWMFGRTRVPLPADNQAMKDKLIALGTLMNKPQGGDDGDGDSDIFAGYTYLGQFIAHDITHDKKDNQLAADLDITNLSTPEVDLDSLYGGEDGPTTHPELYWKDGVRLMTRETVPGDFSKTFMNDLPRGTNDRPLKALIGDARNDENLAVAQTHVAFIYFHNSVVEKLKNEGCPADKLFKTAREEVILHYQWIIVHDFLPKLVRTDVLESVMSDEASWFKGDADGVLYMPLEFSAAAFRIGHSMVRDVYQWNSRRRTGGLDRAARLTDLFTQTGSNKNGFNGQLGLTSDWVIDWRHFYDFDPLNVYKPVERNMAAKLNTIFDMHLDTITGFPDENIDKMQKAITVRNLLRGFYLGLVTGEEAAQRLGVTPLTPEQVAEGPHRSLLEDPLLLGRTPLWYYVLKESELLGFGRDGKTPANRLGPVGGRIVASTLLGLIRQSRHSIFKDKDWRPRFGRPADAAAGTPAKFEIIDLLYCADVVAPLAAHQGHYPGDANIKEYRRDAAAPGERSAQAAN